MKFDIVFVLYNSQKWIDNCLKSIERSDYNLKDVSLYFADNNSSDDSVNIINKYIEENQNKYNDIKIVSLYNNKGFGYGNNQAAKLGNGEYLFFLNIDTEIFPDTLKKLANEINSSSKDIGMFELSQMPYEHPKYYSPLNWETPWASGACMVIKRSLFNKCHGFDSNIFMYCEDVELSFHVRMFGLSIKYLPDVAINHYSYKYPGEDKFVSRMYTPANNFYLRCKYGKAIDVYRGMKINRKFLKNVSHTERRYIKIKFIKMFFAYIGALFFRNDKNFCPKFYGYEYADSRLGSFYPIKNCSAEPLVSIIVRTHNRPKVLRETLISLRNQIYKNFEICIVEDGEDTCTKMLKDEFNDLNIRYEATKKHVGRCAAANIGMKMSKGKYLNFLDDDDFFFADHIKVLVSELESGNYNCAFSLALEERINIYDTNNYKYNITQRLPLPCKYYRQLDIFKANCFPIQSVMFKKTLLNKMIDKGNFDENIDCLEDWDFWIRMGLVDHFHFVDKVTSLYRIPAKPEDYFKRKQEINQYMNYIYKKYQDKKIAITLEQAMIMREL